MKFTSLFSLLLGLFVFSAQANPSPVTIHVYVTDPTITPIMHYWDANEGASDWNKVGQIGGDPYLTSETINGIPFYTITLNTSENHPDGIQIILRDGKGHQTDDITGLKNSEYYITYTIDSYNVSGHQNYYWTAIHSLGITTSNDWSQLHLLDYQSSLTWSITLDERNLPYLFDPSGDVIFKLRPNGLWAGTDKDGSNTNPSGWITGSDDNEGGGNFNYCLNHTDYYYSKYKMTVTWIPNNNADQNWSIHIDGLNPVYTVVGDVAIMGSNWNLTDPNNEMTINSYNGNYTLHKTAKLHPGSYGFKVVTNHKYTESWPENNWIININEYAPYDIDFQFNPISKDIYCSATANYQSIWLNDNIPFSESDYEFVPMATYERSCNANQWGTLCLPFRIEDVTADQYDNVTFYNLSSVDETAMHFTPITSGGIDAGKPVVFKISSSFLSIREYHTYVGGTAGSISANNWYLRGTFTTKQVSGMYVIWDNEIHPSGTIDVPPFRAYFEAPSGFSLNAPMRIDAADTEGLQFVEQDDGSVKAYYDLQGRKLDSVRKGLVIENSKIIMVK